MPLMPADVRNVTFSKPPIGKRGYHEDEVDAFLDVVQAELARLIQEHTDLRNQVAQRDQQLRTAPVDTGNSLRPVGPNARAKAEALDRQSRETAASLEREAARKHTEILGSLS